MRLCLRESIFGCKGLIPWEELSDRFSMNASHAGVTLAYEQSHSIVQYLAGRYGFWRMRRLMQAVTADASLEDVLSKEFHIKLSRLKTNWKRWLQETLIHSPR